MTFYALNNTKHIYFYPHNMLVYQSEYGEPQKIKGERYETFIYPISQHLYTYNTAESLYDVIASDIKIDVYSEFLDVLKTLVKMNVLIEFEAEEIFDYNEDIISLKKLSVTIFTDVDLNYIYGLLKKMQEKFKLSTIIYYKCNKSVQSYLEKNKINLNCNIIYYQETEKILAFSNICNTDIIFDLRYHYMASESLMLSRYCMKKI